MSNKDSAADLLSRSECLGTPGLTACFLLFDEDVSEWEPETLVLGVKEQTGKDLHPDVFQRIMAISTLLNSSSFFDRPEVFHSICATLLDPDPRPQDMGIPPTALEMSWTCVEARLLLGSLYDAQNFEHMVRLYCGLALVENGYISPPKPLSFAVMPKERYPTSGSFQTEDDHTAFWEVQKLTETDLQALLQATLKLYKEQLLSLRDLGGKQPMFDLLEGKTPQPEVTV